MCGRFALFSNIEVILKYADLIDNDLEWRPHYNVSPSMVVPVIISDNNHKVLDRQSWGYLPNFSRPSADKKSIFSIINAKSETISEKPIFRTSFQKRRCLIPANGFYEWRKADRQPFFISIKEQPLIFFAGIWNAQDIASQTSPRSFAIITTNANSKLEPIHHRMPVIIHQEIITEWLFSSDQKHLLDMLKPYPAEEMLTQPVSKEVNQSRINHPGLIQKIGNFN